MTVKDIEDLSFVELEDLLEGMMKYSEREKQLIEKGSVEYKSATDLAAKVQSGQFNF